MVGGWVGALIGWACCLPATKVHAMNMFQGALLHDAPSLAKKVFGGGQLQDDVARSVKCRADLQPAAAASQKPAATAPSLLAAPPALEPYTSTSSALLLHTHTPWVLCHAAMNRLWSLPPRVCCLAVRHVPPATTAAAATKQQQEQQQAHKCELFALE